jgi:polysaccharide biosynthesis transport protein
MSEQMEESRKDGSAVAADPEVVQMRKILAALQARYFDNHPDVVKARESLARLEQEHAKVLKDESAKAPSAARPSADPGRVVMNGNLVRERERVEQLRTQQTLTTKRLEDLESDKTRLLREMSGLQARVSQLPLREQQIAGIARDYETSKANYQSLLDKKLSAQMAAEMEINQKSESFRVLDAARIPEVAVKPNRLVWALAGWGIALALAVGIGLAVEFNKNVLLGEWELPGEIPVLGRVPRIVLQPVGSASAANNRGRTTATLSK